jgi:tetratricopeptide (TPR) repeat protein
MFRRPRLLLTLGFALCLIAVGAVYFWADYQFRQARKALRQDRLDDARRHIQLCLWVWSRGPATHLLAARIERTRGNFIEAEQHLKEATRLQGGSSEATQLEWVLMRAQAGELDELSGGLRECLEAKHPDSAAILETLARVYMRETRLGYAKVCLDRWIELEPEAGHAYYWRGWVWERLNNPHGARDDYQRALELAPWRWDIQLRLAEMSVADNSPTAALPYLRPLMQTHADDPQVMTTWAGYLMLKGKTDEAQQVLDQVLQAHPDDLGALLQRGRLAFETSGPEKAEGYLRRALAIRPTHPDVLFQLSRVLQRIPGRATEAEEIMARTEQLKADQTRLQTLLRMPSVPPSEQAAWTSELGTLFIRLGEDMTGLEWLHRALREDPQCGPAHEALARYYEAHGQPAKAAPHRKAAGHSTSRSPAPASP